MINNNIYCSLLQPLKHFCQKVSVAPCSHSLLEPRSCTVPWRCSSVCSYHLCDSRATRALVMLSHLMALGAACQSPGSCALTCRQHCSACKIPLVFIFFSFLLHYHTFTAPVKYPKLTHFTFTALLGNRIRCLMLFQSSVLWASLWFSLSI